MKVIEDLYIFAENSLNNLFVGLQMNNWFKKLIFFSLVQFYPSLRASDIKLTKSEVSDFNHALDEVILDYTSFVSVLGYERVLKSKKTQDVDEQVQIENFLKDKGNPPSFHFYYLAGLLSELQPVMSGFTHSRPDLHLQELSAKNQDLSSPVVDPKTGAKIGATIGAFVILALFFHFAKDLPTAYVGEDQPAVWPAPTIGNYIRDSFFVSILASAGAATGSVVSFFVSSLANVIPKFLKSSPVDLADMLDLEQLNSRQSTYVYCKAKNEPWSYSTHHNRYFQVHGHWGALNVSGKKIYAFATLSSALKIALECAYMIRKDHPAGRLNPDDIEYMVGDSYATAHYPLAFYLKVDDEHASSLSAALHKFQTQVKK